MCSESASSPAGKLHCIRGLNDHPSFAYARTGVTPIRCELQAPLEPSLRNIWTVGFGDAA